MKLTSFACFLTLAGLGSASAIPEASVAAAKPQCGPKVVSLATGIHLNIGGQHTELADTKALQRLEGMTDFKSARFHVDKGKLISDILGGMSIRKYNQAIAPKDNPVVPGLATYAKAQETELKLAKSLNGNPDHDRKILATLVSDIKSGTMLNMENLSNATEHCSLGFTFPK